MVDDVEATAEFHRQVDLFVDGTEALLTGSGTAGTTMLNQVTYGVGCPPWIVLQIAVLEISEATGLSRNGVCRALVRQLERKGDPTALAGAHLVTAALRPEPELVRSNPSISPDLLYGAYVEAFACSVAALIEAWRLDVAATFETFRLKLSIDNEMVLEDPEFEGGAGSG